MNSNSSKEYKRTIKRCDNNKSSALRKGAWTPQEDMILKNHIQKFGEGKWHLVPLKAGLNRCRKSCRLRWLNYLRPDIKRGDFKEDEVDLMRRLHKLLGNRWSLIAGRLPGRTANDVKNYWNTHVLGRSKKQKAELKEDESSQDTIIQAIKPQVHTISKGLDVYPSMEPLNSSSFIISSHGGFNNVSPWLVSSPSVSDGQINEYLNELFQDQDKEMHEAGCSLGSFSMVGEDLHVFGRKNREHSLFDFPTNEGI